MTEITQKCSECYWARQAADRARQDVVGCVNMDRGGLAYQSARGQLYTGWFYAKRAPGDVSDKDNFAGRGALVNGYLIDAGGRCELFTDGGAS